MDAAERERALEARVAELELRLRRLELAQGDVASVPASPAASTTAAFTAPSTAPAAPPPPPEAPATATGEPAWLSATRATVPEAATVASSPTRAGPEPQRPSPKPRVSVSLADLEARLTGRALAWVGGLALVLGAIFFLSLAFTRGWIGPEARVVIGLIGGAVSLGAGAVFMDRRNRLLGHVLTPVGLAIISISLVGATRLYGLIPVELGLLLALASSIAAAAVAVRADSPIVAAFGLIAVLAAPPLLGATPDMVTLAFVAAVLLGTTGVALWRSWPWLPIVAFLLSAPQLASWITGDPAPIAGIVGIVGFWLINLVAAAGEEVRRHRDDLSASSATLMLANAAFLVWAGFALLDGDLVTYRGPFLVLIALTHLAVGAAFIRRDGDADLFGLLTIGTGLAALSMAAPVQFGADAIPIAWTAEAVALAWVAARRGHPYSAMVASGLYVLAGAYLVQAFGLSAWAGSDSPMRGL
ncbi:MAG: putative rane protein, partial [Chloroflexota bacterium]|nr:putative rane protein [Chloroflexota bacterium]